MDIREELKKENINLELSRDNTVFTFTMPNDKKIVFYKEQLDSLFLTTLVNQLKFQSGIQ